MFEIIRGGDLQSDSPFVIWDSPSHAMAAFTCNINGEYYLKYYLGALYSCVAMDVPIIVEGKISFCADQKLYGLLHSFLTSSFIRAQPCVGPLRMDIRI